MNQFSPKPLSIPLDRFNFFRKFTEIFAAQGALSGKFAVGVVDTCGILPPVVHLDLRISPRIFEKIQNDPDVIFRGLGEGDSLKIT